MRHVVDAQRLRVDRRVDGERRPRALPATRGAGRRVARCRRPRGARTVADDRLRLGLRRREADGAQAVVETVDAFVGHVEPFIARLALGGRTRPLVYVTSSERMPRHAIRRCDSAPAPHHRVAVGDRLLGPATVGDERCASSMSSWSAACTWNGLRHVLEITNGSLVAGVDAHVAGAERALHPGAPHDDVVAAAVQELLPRAREHAAAHDDAAGRDRGAPRRATRGTAGGSRAARPAPAPRPPRVAARCSGSTTTAYVPAARRGRRAAAPGG